MTLAINDQGKSKGNILFIQDNLVLSTELTMQVSHRKEIRWLTYIVKSVDKTKSSCNTPTDAAPQFLQKLTPFIIQDGGRVKFPTLGIAVTVTIPTPTCASPGLSGPPILGQTIDKCMREGGREGVTRYITGWVFINGARKKITGIVTLSSDLSSNPAKQ